MNRLSNELYRDTGSMCNIWTNQKVSFALVGLYITKAKEEAIIACNKYSSFDEIMEKYITAFGNYILNDLEEKRVSNPKAFQQFVNDNSPNLSQIFFFGKQSDTLFSYVVRFQVDNNPLKNVEVRYLIGQRDLLYGGKVDEIRDTAENPKTWKKDKIIPKTIEALIAIEAKAHPEWVGGATDIIMVTRKKIRWLKKKAFCE